jgi:hypothetical protein
MHGTSVMPILRTASARPCQAMMPFSPSIRIGAVKPSSRMLPAICATCASLCVRGFARVGDQRLDRAHGAQSFATRLVMHWPSVLTSANPLRKGQRFVRPSRKDAGRDLCGRRNGVFQVSRTKPCAQFELFIAETEHGHRLSPELDGYEFKDRFVGHDPFPFVRGPMLSLIGRGSYAAPSFLLLL